MSQDCKIFRICLLHGSANTARLADRLSDDFCKYPQDNNLHRNTDLYCMLQYNKVL